MSENEGVAANPEHLRAKVERSSQWHALPPDYQGVDQVTITTIPRLKESELSGDEWRISASIQFYRKGVLLGGRSFHDAETAVRFADWAMMELNDHGHMSLANPEYNELCDQEGCLDKATVRYRMKQEYCKNGHPHPPSHQVLWRQFCNKHKYRGNSDMNDRMDNYEEIPFESVSVKYGKAEPQE